MHPNDANNVEKLTDIAASTATGYTHKNLAAGKHY